MSYNFIQIVMNIYYDPSHAAFHFLEIFTFGEVGRWSKWKNMPVGSIQKSEKNRSIIRDLYKYSFFYICYVHDSRKFIKRINLQKQV